MKNQEVKRFHLMMNKETFNKIEEWNEIYGLNTTAFIRLAIKEKLNKEKL